MIQRVVINVGPPAIDGAPLARANVRHSFNIANGKIEDSKKNGLHRSDPGPVARQQKVVATCSKYHWIV